MVLSKFKWMENFGGSGMTVKELISKLQEMPQDMNVYAYGSFEEETVNDVFIDDMYIDKDKTEKVVFI